MPVSASNTSLLRFIQARKKIAADKKYKIFRYGWSYFQQKQQRFLPIGIIATLYIGGLIAASHNLVFDMKSAL